MNPSKGSLKINAKYNTEFGELYEYQGEYQMMEIRMLIFIWKGHIKEIITMLIYPLSHT